MNPFNRVVVLHSKCAMAVVRMRYGAILLSMCLPYVYGCEKKSEMNHRPDDGAKPDMHSHEKNCEMNHCPDDFTNSDVTVAFYDGSANGYIFHRNSVEYRPVRPEESSSRTYSGGKPFKRPLDAVMSAQIARTFNAAIDTPASHIPNRVMGSGVISIQCGEQSRDWILAQGSAELQAIEELLKKL